MASDTPPRLVRDHPQHIRVQALLRGMAYHDVLTSEDTKTFPSHVLDDKVSQAFDIWTDPSADYKGKYSDFESFIVGEGICICDGEHCLSVPLTKAERLQLKKEEELSPREALLRESNELVTRQRNSLYGEPTQDFKRSVGAMNAFGYCKTTPEGDVVLLEPHDVAILIDIVKTSRLMWSPGHRDNWADKAGYSACGWECAVEEGYAE